MGRKYASRIARAVVAAAAWSVCAVLAQATAAPAGAAKRLQERIELQFKQRIDPPLQPAEPEHRHGDAIAPWETVSV